MKSLTLLISMLICERFYSQNVQIKYYNRTGYNIDSIFINNDYLTLKKDSATPFILLHEIQQIGLESYPFSYGMGKIKELGQRLYFPIECITGYQTITEGKFELDYLIKHDPKGYYLYIIPHREIILGDN